METLLGRWRGHPTAVLVTLCLGFFMTLLDTSIVNVAIPHMVDGLDATFDQVLWVLNAYVLVFAVLVLLCGRLGDLFGPRAMLVVGMTVFTLASLLCGLAQSAEVLIAARAVQGLGAACMAPQTLALLTATFPPERRGAAFGVWSAIGGVAPVAGPIVGGALVNEASWRWIFLINLPLGVLIVAMALALVPEVEERRRSALDVRGVVLSTLGLLLITYGLIEGQKYDWGQVRSFVGIPLIIGVGVALVAVFVLDQWRRQDRQPLLPFALFSDRGFSTMMFVTAAVLFSVAALLLPLTIYLQSALGLSALGAGLVLAPPMVVQFVLAPVAGRQTDRIGGKFILFAGLLLFAAGLGLVAATARHDSHWSALMPGLLVAGAGMGAVFATMNAMAMKDVPPKLAGAASGVVSAARQLGMVFGGAAVGALLQNRLATELSEEAGRNAARLPPQAREPFVRGFESATEDGLEVGAQQSARLVRPPSGLPREALADFEAAATDVFTHAFTTAMRVSMALPLAVLVVAALTCLLLRKPARTPAAAPSREADQEVSPPAD
ncbi:DHA2 family efflux MFS transporter permease subunit [Streptomyces sp. NPDC059063]|uniref:DHA2 family efflux MFS transporter permease subunit n=1 Tax=unclassified Streptomyces TaxID=2593676 RepID=UPI003697E885